MKRVLPILFVLIIVLVGCGKKDDLTVLSEQLATVEGDTSAVDNTLLNMKYLDEVLLEGNLEFPAPERVDVDTSSNVEVAGFFINVRDVNFTALGVELKRLEFGAGQINEEEFNKIINDYKAEYEKNRDSYITIIEEYILNIK